MANDEPMLSAIPEMPDLASMGLERCTWDEAMPMANDKAPGEDAHSEVMALVLWRNGGWKIDGYSAGMRGIHERTHGTHPTYLYDVYPVRPARTDARIRILEGLLAEAQAANSAAIAVALEKEELARMRGVVLDKAKEVEALKERGLHAAALAQALIPFLDHLAYLASDGERGAPATEAVLEVDGYRLENFRLPAEPAPGDGDDVAGR